MRKFTSAVVALTLLCGTTAILAQDAERPERPDRGPRAQRGEEGGRRFDPEQMRQRIMDALKERLQASDEEWQVLQPKIERVMQAQQNARTGGMMGFGGRGGFGRDQDQGEQSELARAASSLRDTLQDDNASADQISQGLEAFRAARQKAETELQAAQQDLQGVLTQRQEALLVMSGMLE